MVGWIDGLLGGKLVGINVNSFVWNFYLKVYLILDFNTYLNNTSTQYYLSITSYYLNINPQFIRLIG